MKRRDFVKAGLITGGAALLTTGAALVSPLEALPGRRKLNLSNAQIGSPTLPQLATGPEEMPTSPFILSPFTEPLPIPVPLAPATPEEVATWASQPGPGVGQQDIDGGTHQVWTSDLGLPDPIIYNIKLQLAAHCFTHSPVRTLVDFVDETGGTVPAGTVFPEVPDSTMYGFNGTFPGPEIRAFYGEPVLIRFENNLDENPLGLDRGDFGVPEFLTHLHNGHTAPESDGNPHHKPEGYQPGDWCDNLYLNYPAGGDDRNKQSTLWFHDHRMDNTSANVYKGMVGFYPIYDAMDSGDETRGYRLPGFDYDIPIIAYDLRLDDGAARHNGLDQNGEPHPENFGKLFFAHYPNAGFIGDIFTINGQAYPVLHVKRRKYRFRFLDASLARWYRFSLMTGSPVAAPGELGQYLLSGAQQAMRLTQIASEGGLLPQSFVRDSFDLAPAKRKEFIVDFTQYQNGSPTRNGDVIYLTNSMQMDDGRKPRDVADPGYIVPMMQIIIDGDELAPDQSLILKNLRGIPPVPSNKELQRLVHRTFSFDRSGGDWVVNGRLFDPGRVMASPKKGSGEVWTLTNNSGGWVHPVHFHMEQHRVLSRNGLRPPLEDTSKEDVVALGPGETVVIYRKFRTFTGKYVSHCHNLAHEDHAMMFAWEIVP